MIKKCVDANGEVDLAPIALGSLKDLHNKQFCSSCSVLSSYLEHFSEFTASSDLLLQASYWFFEEQRVEIIATDSETRSRPLMSAIVLVPLDTPCEYYGRGRLVDQYRIDMNAVRKWIERCDTWHVGCCHLVKDVDPLPLSRAQLSSMKLADTERSCIVAAASSHRYIALSYVWGGANLLQTTKANLAELENEGGINAGHLPRTISDAMKLVRLLGKRYLWVDCLCIVQDDGEVKHSQIQNMAAIYANAYLTVIAADGSNADAGLPGLEGGTSCRNVNQQIVEFIPGNRLQLKKDMNRTTLPVWEERGWTFQEQIYSRRSLTFSNQRIFWDCQCSHWEEEEIQRKDPEEDLIDYKTSFGKHMFGDGFRFKSWPDLEDYGNLVDEYSRRQFTFQQDVLFAFTGITSMLSQSWEGGFLYGLPEMFFDIALLWQPFDQVQRKRAPQSPDQPQLPSWSWIGWTEGISCRAFMFNGVTKGSFARRDEGHAVDTIVQWHKSLQRSEGLTPITNSWQKYARKTSETSKPLPSGWSRHDSSDDQVSKVTTTFFRHSLYGDTDFYYPIPVPTQVEESRPWDWSPILRFRTNRAWFRLGKQSPYDYDKRIHSCYIATVVDATGRWAGVIRLNRHYASNFVDHSNNLLTGSDGTSENDYLERNQAMDNSIDKPMDSYCSEDVTCELIAISAGSVPNDAREGISTQMDEWDVEERPKTAPGYEYYNVLWIERQGGIAYRKALGRIYKPVWEQQDLEMVDIKLG